MRVHLGGDHAAYDLLGELVSFVGELGHEAISHGPFVYDAQDDYPVFVLRAAEAVAAEPDSLVIVLGGSGNGEQIAANKVNGVRAALAWNLDTARLARQHNNANVISIGARQHDRETAGSFVDAFLAEPFSHDPRHQRRIDLLTAYEGSR